MAISGKQIINGTIGAIKTDGSLLKTDGSIALSGDWSAGGFRITGIPTTPTAPTDAVNQAYVDANVKIPLTSPLTLYVTVAGSDLTGDGTVGNPFRQIQRALTELEKYNIQASVTVSVGPGSFAAFSMDGGKITVTHTLPVAPSAALSVTVLGTYTTAIPATGTATGAVTASVASNGTYTVTDSTQTWTINDLRRKFLRFDSGSLTGLAYPIESNTATVLTVRMLSTAPVGTLYTIVDHATLIDSGTVYSGGNINGYRVVVAGFQHESAGTATVRALRISLDGAGGVRCACRATLRECLLVRTTGTSTPVTMIGNGSVLNCYSELQGTSGIHINQNNGAGYCTHTYVVCRGGATGLNLSAWGGPVYIGGWTFETVTTGMALANCMVNWAGSSRWVTCGTGIAIQTTYPGAPCQASSATTSLHYFESCTNILTAQGADITLGNCAGVTNTNGIVITKGSRVQIGPTATLGAVNEISVDGTVITLAALRALTPIAYPATASPYGTVVYE